MNTLVETSQVVSGKLSGNPNLIYDKIENCDIVRAPYMDRFDPLDFGLYKRKAYKNIMGNPDYIGWDFTDSTKIRVGQCDDTGWTVYNYAVSPDGTEGQMLRHGENVSGTVNCIGTEVFGDPFCVCDCQFKGMVKSMGPAGPAETLPGGNDFSILGVQDSALSGAEGRFWIGTDSGYGTHEDLTTYLFEGEYIYAYCAGSASTDGLGGQIRKIIGYDSGAKEWILDAPWTLGTAVTDRKNVSFRVFEDWGEVINYVTCEGINTLHPNGAFYETTLACNSTPADDVCISGLERYDNRLFYLNDRGWLTYGGTGYDQYFFTVNNLVPLPAQTVAIKTFQDHLVYMGYDFIGVVYSKEFYGLTGYAAYPLSDQFGIWSKESFLSDTSAFYIVTSEKEFKALSFISDGKKGFRLQEVPVTNVFAGELKRLEKGDQVYINKVGPELRVHIVTREYTQDGVLQNSGTKILIYDTETALYHTHNVCDARVTKYANETYLGDGVYRRCGYEDGGYPGEDGLTIGTVFYDQTIKVFIGSNKNNGLTFDVFNPKRLKTVKSILGPSIITDGNTYFKYTYHRLGYKPNFVLDDWTTIPWIQNMNTIASGEDVSVDNCVLDDLLDCQDVNNPCEDGRGLAIKPSSCNCGTQYYDPREYCVCYEDSKYMLALVYPVVSKFHTKHFDLGELEWKSMEGDRLYFQGFDAEVVTGQAIDNYDDDNRIEQQACCTRQQYVAPVTGLTAAMASVTCGAVTLSWTASATTGVTYTVREGETVLASGLAVLTYLVGDVTGVHTYKVYAVKAGSESVMADVQITASYCPPAAPSGAAVSAYSCGTTVNLTWSASATSGVTYNVYDGVTLLGNTASTNYSATGLSYASHTFTIKALKNGIESTTGTSVVQVTTECVIVMAATSAAAFGGNPYNVLVTGSMTLNGNTVTEKGIVYYVTGNPGTEIGDAGVTKVIGSPTLPEGVYTVLNVGMTPSTSFSFRTYSIDSGAVEHYSPTAVTYVVPA